MVEKTKIDSWASKEVKIDEYDDVIFNFNKTMPDIEVQTDMSDHLTFICSKCKTELKVLKVETTALNEDYDTVIVLACLTCKAFGEKKFYWNMHQRIFLKD